MSWDSYVTNMLIDWFDEKTEKIYKSNVKHGMILGKNGAIWATSPGFELKQQEIEVETEEGAAEKVTINEFENLMDAFNNKGQTSKKGGIYINGVKYFTVNSDEVNGHPVLYLKSKVGGACLAGTAQAVVIGVFVTEETCTVTDAEKQTVVKNQNPGTCNRVVENLQDTLIGMGM